MVVSHFLTVGVICSGVFNPHSATDMDTGVLKVFELCIGALGQEMAKMFIKGNVDK